MLEINRVSCPDDVLFSTPVFTAHYDPLETARRMAINSKCISSVIQYLGVDFRDKGQEAIGTDYAATIEGLNNLEFNWSDPDDEQHGAEATLEAAYIAMDDLYMAAEHLQDTMLPGVGSNVELPISQETGDASAQTTATFKIKGFDINGRWQLHSADHPFPSAYHHYTFDLITKHLEPLPFTQIS
jgi:hypothetical protein